MDESPIEPALNPLDAPIPTPESEPLPEPKPEPEPEKPLEESPIYKVGDRVKAIWLNEEGNEIEGYGEVSEIAVTGEYIVKIERDADGIPAGSVIIAKSVSTPEPVIETGGVERIPSIGQMPSVSEKTPMMNPVPYSMGSSAPYYQVPTQKPRRRSPPRPRNPTISGMW